MRRCGRSVRVATLEETLRYGRAGLDRRRVLPPMAGGASWSLVGSAGALTNGGASPATPAWGAGANRTSGNLLVCWCATNTGSQPAISAGWSVALHRAGASNAAQVFYKIATGADAAPTLTLAGQLIWAQLAEFAGGAAVGDQTAGSSGSASPMVATAAAADAWSGELVAYSGIVAYNPAQAATLAVALNNGAASNDTTSPAGSNVTHTVFGWGVTTGDAAGDSASFTFDTPSFYGGALAVASFKPGDLPYMPHRMPQGV